MEQFIIQFHSGLRYLVLALLLATIINGVWAIIQKKPFVGRDRFFALATLAVTHIQVLLGVILYFISSKVVFSELTMKVKLFRFFTVEHALMMLVAVVLITVGFSKAKRAPELNKHKIVVIFYTIALVLILSAIPWALMV